MTRLRVRVLPRAARLRRPADFQRVVRSGRRSSCQTVVVHLLDDASEPEARIGFVVSKAVGNAVVRNRVRRRLQNAVGEERFGLGRVLVVVRANPAAATASFALLMTDLQRCLRKAQGGARRRT